MEAGELIFIDIPEQSSKPNPTHNERMGGIYMISALCHKITPGKGNDGFQAITSLELVRDSYGRKPNTSSSSGSGETQASPGSIKQSSSTGSGGITDQDIKNVVNDENTLMQNQADAAKAESDSYKKSFDSEGFQNDANQFTYNPVTGRYDPND